jgi:pilus assembly protein CpaE
MAHPLTFVIFTSRDDDAQDLREALNSDQRVRVTATSDDAQRVYSEVARWHPSAVIINLGIEPEPDWILCRQISALCPQTMIICASRRTSPDLILDSLRAGSREFLRLPVIADELKTVIDRTAEFCASESIEAKKRGRVISVFSNKGGCGSSFIAANLAVALDAPSTLVDLNLQAPSQDLFFGVKAKFSIADVVENRARLDDQLLSGLLIKCSPKLSLLPAPQNAEAAEDLRTDDITEVIDVLQEHCDYVVLDLPHTFDSNTIAALDQSDEILLVLTLDILAARAAQRALAIFGRLGYSRERVRLVLNRWNKHSDLELKHVERFLGERISSFISEDYRTVVNSINLGQPLVAAQSSATITAELKRLADICAGKKSKSEARERSNVLSAIFQSRASMAKEALRTFTARLPRRAIFQRRAPLAPAELSRETQKF